MLSFTKSLKRESSTGNHRPYRHQNFVPKLFWQLSPDVVLLPMWSASSESRFVILHCIFNNWTSCAFFQTSSGFGLKMTAARVHLAAETGYLSRGWKVSMQVMLFGSQTLHVKASFPCWSMSCLWGSFLLWVRGFSLSIWKMKVFKALPKGKKNPTLNTEGWLNSPTGVQRKEAELWPRKTGISLKTSCSTTQHYIHAPCLAIIY